MNIMSQSSYNLSSHPSDELSLECWLSTNTNEPEYSLKHTEDKMTQGKREFLGHLPPGDTSEYKYSGPQALQDIIAQEKKQYIVFTDISESEVEKLDEEIPKKVDFHKGYQILILNMPKGPHERCAHRFEGSMARKAEKNGVYRLITFRGAERAETPDRAKQADLSWSPRFRPPNRSWEWPTVALEVGYSETKAKLEQDMAFWLNKSQGDVLMAISIDIKRPSGNIYITTWEQGTPTRGTPEPPPIKLQEVQISRTQPPSFVGNPLTIPFSRLLLRKPSPPAEQDFIFSKDELLDMADEVWELMREQGHLNTERTYR